MLFACQVLAGQRDHAAYCCGIFCEYEGLCNQRKKNKISGYVHFAFFRI